MPALGRLIARQFLAAALIAAAAGDRTAPATAAEIRVATWNVHEGFSVAGLAARRQDFQAFAARVRPDVLVMEEVVSAEVVQGVATGMGLGRYHVACSNFAPADRPDFSDFEVAVISRYPITQVIEYDATPDNDPTRGDPPELPIGPALKAGLRTPAETAGVRGFLWVRIEALKLTVIGVHLKSSRGADGESDHSNAERREFVAAAVAESVAQDRRLYPDYTCIVAGDFNVGHSDPKNGRNLARDDFDPSVAGYDGYDETHALLSEGLLGVRMRNLASVLKTSTFPAFPSTPIDNLYVDGPAAARFSPASMESETFGSDHRPVHAVLRIEGALPPAAPAAIAAGGPKKPAAAGTRPPPAASSAATASPAASAPAGDKPPLVTVDQLAAHFGRRVIVEFDCRNGSLINQGRLGFLNSLVDFRDPKNLTVVLNEPVLKQFAAAGIADPPRHFRGKRLRVTGVVELRRGQHQMVAASPADVEIVPPK